MRLRTRCELLMWKGSWLNVRVGESSDRWVLHRQRQRALIAERSSHKARLTKLNTSDDETAERPSRSSRGGADYE